MGQNLAKEAVKDPTAATFLAASAELVPPAVYKQLAKAYKIAGPSHAPPA
jgi:hypothetical protein